MKTRNLIGSLASIIAVGLCACEHPQTIEEPLPEPSLPTYSLTFRAYREHRNNYYLEKGDMYVYPYSASIAFDTILLSNESPILYTLLHTTDTIDVFRSISKDVHKAVLDSGRYKILEAHYPGMINDTQFVCRYKIKDLHIFCDTSICDTLFESDWNFVVYK